MKRRNRCGRAISFFGAFCLVLSHSFLAGAATIPVTTLDDDGAVNGNCTLREAIQAANDNAAFDLCPAGSSNDGDIVDLSGLGGTITLGSALPAITDALTLRGPGAGVLAIDAGGTGRVLLAQSGAGGPPLTVIGLTVKGGSTAGRGGGIASYGVLELQDCVVTGNAAALGGGGIFNMEGIVLIADSTIRANHSGSNGGGIETFNGATSIERSAIVGNEAAGNGGGIYSEGLLTFENSTLSGNTGGYDGGGLYVRADVAIIDHATIADNSGPIRGDGIFVDDLGMVSMRNTILAGQADNCGVLNVGKGIIDSMGNNLEDADECYFDHATDRTNTDPLLEPLRDNGGPSATHALPAGSPAIDGAAAGPAAGLDQRGIGRSFGSAPDIGAFEYAVSAAPAGVVVVSYGETGRPVLDPDSAAARAVTGGDLSSGFVQVSVGLLPGAVSTDLYLGITLPGTGGDILLVTPDLSFPSASDQLVPWKTGVTAGVYEDLFGTIPVDALPAGTYDLYLLRQETGGDFSSFDLWVSSFDIP